MLKKIIIKSILFIFRPWLLSLYRYTSFAKIIATLPPQQLLVIFFKGPFHNALVFLNLDGDKVLDEYEQYIRTDATGGFLIDTSAVYNEIVALTDDNTVYGAAVEGAGAGASAGAADCVRRGDGRRPRGHRSVPLSS